MIRRQACALTLMLSLAMGSGLAAAAAEVRLYAAGSLRGSHDRAGRGLGAHRRGDDHGDVRRVGPAARTHRERRARRRVRIGQHGASAVARHRRQGGAGGAVRAQHAVCAGRAGRRGDQRQPAGPDARSEAEARHVDAEGRSLGRLCLGAVRTRRRGEAGRARGAGGKGPGADRRADVAAAAEGRQRLRPAGRAGPGRHLPDLLHQRRRRAEGVPAAAGGDGARGVLGRRRLRIDGAERRATRGGELRPLRPVDTRAADPRRPWLRAADNSACHPGTSSCHNPATSEETR